MAPPSRRSTSNMFTSPLLSILCLVYLFSSTALAASAVIGVDLGTEYIKAALVKPGIPFEIVLTKDSRRKELSAVTFKPTKGIKSGEFPERLYGSDAMSLSARFPADVYPNLKSLIGLTTDNSVVKEYVLRHPALKFEADTTRSTSAFKSSAFASDELAWTVEELLAMQLQSIQKNAEALAGKGSRIRDVVITIPVYYTAEEKRAVLMAAELAGLRVLELISDGLAVGVNYAKDRKFPDVTEGGKPEYHMVFDMGAGSTKATIMKFQARTVKDIGKFNKTVQEVQVLGSGWDRTLGGDALNAAIVDDMIAQFVASPAAKRILLTVDDVKAHGRAAAKLWKEAERLRQILSANADSQAGFEGLYEDVDFRYKITRAAYEKLAEPYIPRISAAMQSALNMAGLHVKDIDSIILHGGAIRTPFVQKELEKFIGKAEKVRTNVNSDEAAVFGAAFRGATLSPSFRVKEVRSSEGAAYAAGIKWVDVNDKAKTQKLWQPTSFVGAEKQYTFKNQKDFSIDFYQVVPASENASPGSTEKELLTLTSKNLTESIAHLKEKFSCTDSDITLKMSTRLSSTQGEVEITKFYVDCEVEGSDEKAGIMDNIKGAFGFGKKDQAPLSEEGESSSSSTVSESTKSTSTSTGSESPSASASSKEAKKPAKPVKRWEVVPVKHTIELKGLPQLPAAEVKRMKDRLASFEDSDRSRRLREEALNQLEGFTYKARELLENEEFIAASTKNERQQLEEERESASDWIYSGGTEATREELKSRLKVLKDIVGPIEKRREEAASRPAKVEVLEKGLKETEEVVERLMQQIQNDTAAIESWSSSKSAASATPTPSPSPSPVDEFEGLEDEPSTSTTTATPEEETPPTMSITPEDLIPVQKLYGEIKEWLGSKLAEQEALPPTTDPVLTISELDAKTKELETKRVDVVLKAMKLAFQPKFKKPTAKKPKAKTSKTKKAKGTKSATAKDPEKSRFRFPDNMGDLSEEEILAMIEKVNKEQAENVKAAEEKYAAENEGEAEAEGEKEVPLEEAEANKDDDGKKEHDEL